MATDKTSELMEVFFQLSRLMKEKMSFSGKVIHVSILQIHALMYIKSHTDTSMTDIAKFLNIELPSATSLINKLHSQKLIERQEDPKDRRLVNIRLSAKGKEQMEEIITERKKKMHKMLSYLSMGEKIELLNIMKTLYSKLLSEK